MATGTAEMPKLRDETSYRNYFKQSPMLLILVALAAVFTVFVDNFVSYANFANMARLFAPLLILAIGMTIVFIAGGIDLSVGSTASMASVVCALVIQHTGIVALGFAAGVGTGLLIGAINGAVIAFFRLPALVFTLAMLLTVRATALLITGGYSVGKLPLSVLAFGRGSFLAIPNLLWVSIAVLLLAALFLARSRRGREIYLVGTSERAATFNALRVTSTKFIAYLVCGGCAGLAGVTIVARLGSGGPVVGDNLLLSGIAAVVLGGTSIHGGEGTVFKTLIGTLIVILLEKGLNLFGLSFYDQAIVMGAVIVAGASFSAWMHRRQSTR